MDIQVKLRGVSNVVFVVTAVVLIVIAAIGYYLYYTKPTTVQTVTPPSGGAPSGGAPSGGVAANVFPVNGAFANGKVVAFIYTSGEQCASVPTSFFPSSDVANKVMNCEVGIAPSSPVSGAKPLWVLVPVFAGLSIFGVPQLGASPEGYPTFNGITILTHCGASGTPSGCMHHPPLLYSPAFDVVERYLNITNGVFGLPQGVLPTPAHSHLVEDVNTGFIPWTITVVLVFDPNIFPDPITGRCHQIAPSSLPNPTANCLNSTDALKRAMVTQNAAIAQINAKNPIWLALNKAFNTQILTQVVIPGVSDPSKIGTPNSNLVLVFDVKPVNPYFNMTYTTGPATTHS